MEFTINRCKRHNLLCELTLDILYMVQVYYTYILKCNDGTKYYGHTNNLSERLKEHKKGRIYSTKNKQPELAYYEEFDSRSDAFRREMQFKNGKTRKSTIEKLIVNFHKQNVKG